MVSLLGCPFCGKPAQRCKKYVRCSECGCDGPFTSDDVDDEQCEIDWNIRLHDKDLLEASENLLFRIRNIGYWNKPDTEMYIKALEAAVEKAKGN